MPKDNSPRMSGAAPPPYTPPARQPSLHSFINMAAARGIPLSELQQALVATQRTIATHVLNDAADDACADTDGADGSLYPLTMRINTSINVTKNDNIVCLSDTPTQHANAIAAALTKAIEDSSSGGCGIPMVDGDGNPRPIKIEVDAGFVVDGQRNIIGTEASVLNILRQREETSQGTAVPLRRRRQDDDEGDNEGSEEQGEPSTKRRRSD